MQKFRNEMAELNVEAIRLRDGSWRVFQPDTGDGLTAGVYVWTAAQFESRFRPLSDDKKLGCGVGSDYE